MLVSWTEWFGSWNNIYIGMFKSNIISHYAINIQYITFNDCHLHTTDKINFEKKIGKMWEQKLRFSIKDIIYPMPWMYLRANMARGRRKALICYINWYPTKEIKSLIFFQKYLKMVLTAANHELFIKWLFWYFSLFVCAEKLLRTCVLMCMCVCVCVCV